jgi:hypothetical protein
VGPLILWAYNKQAHDFVLLNYLQSWDALRRGGVSDNSKAMGAGSNATALPTDTWR